MTSTSKQLLRWISLDASLASFGMNAKAFVHQHGVTRATFVRDLAAFRELGQRIVLERDRREVWFDCWRYAPGAKPLFTRNLQE